jgi:predicted metal-binding membrane protein
MCSLSPRHANILATGFGPKKPKEKNVTDNDIAWLAGLAATMIPTAIYVILLVTRDYRPIERRARRFAILASVIASVAIWSVTATVFFLVSELIGNFLMFPSIALTAVAVWHASTITYRKMGGGKESPDSRSGEARAGS